MGSYGALCTEVFNPVATGYEFHMHSLKRADRIVSAFSGVLCQMRSDQTGQPVSALTGGRGLNSDSDLAQRSGEPSHRNHHDRSLSRPALIDHQDCPSSEVVGGLAVIRPLCQGESRRSQ